MKLTLRKAQWVLFGLIVFSKISASVPESCLLFSITSQQTARLGIINSSNKSLDLSITNIAGENFFSKMISGNQNFFQILDLSKMPNGEYSVSLSGLDETIVRRFMISDVSVQLLKEVKEAPPAFHLLDDRTLTISYINTQGNLMNIRLEAGNEVIFQEDDLTDMALSKRYSLKKLPRGNYTARLLSGKKTYSYPIVLN